MDDSNIEVGLLELVPENEFDFRVLLIESLTLRRNGRQQVFPHAILVVRQCVLVVLDLHVHRCEIEICLNVERVKRQRFLVNAAQLRQHVH